MNDAMLDWEQRHSEVSALLDRYAQLLLDDRDAGAMYPEVEEHLAHCAACRMLLDALLKPDTSPDDRTPELPLPRTNFLEERSSETSVRVSQWSLDKAFCVRIGFAPPSDASSHVPPTRSGSAGARGMLSIPADGRLLLNQTFEVVGTPIEMILTLYPGEAPDQYDVVAELFADELPATVNARLHVDSQVYFAYMQGNTIRFSGVCYPEEPENLQITLESI